MDHVLLLTGLGLIASAVAIIAWIGDRRRFHRQHIDRVGIMPWTTIFFWALLVAVLCLGMAARAWMAR
ncbi:hypothetical protein ASE49_12610 [Novosphingobium sp. Leaf2]|nr:hypothetical protein ASE49_12610 [Novosphingobium sp. Leaf2]